MYRTEPSIFEFVCCYCLFYYLDTSNLGQHGSLVLEAGVALSQSSLSLSSHLGGLLDILEVLSSSLSSLSGQSLNELLALPTSLRSQIAEDAELSLWLQAESLGGLRDSHLLLLVIRSWDTVEDLQALEGGLTSGGLVWEHTTNSSPEHHRRSSVVKRASSWVGSGGLVLELLVLQGVSEKGTRNVDTLTSHNSLSIEYRKKRIINR